MTSKMLKYGLIILSGTFLAGCQQAYHSLGINTAQNTATPAPSSEITGSISPNSGTISDPAMAAWQTAYADYDKKATTYWNQVAEMRKVRNAKRANGQTVQLTDYVLTQPPVYNGPAKPKSQVSSPTVQRSTIPKMSDFVAASQKSYGFTPERASNEAQFMRSYAKAAQQLGFTRDQLVGIYAFETGGNGTHDLQAGMLNGNANPISTAVGYNQLIATASVSLMWEYGKEIAAELRARGNQSNGSEKERLYKKAQVVDKMTAVAKTVPHNWAQQGQLAKTQAGMGIHAALIDKDIGPLMQIHKLKTSIQFLKNKGIHRPVSGAELEMLNLTGDGNGFDMVSMPMNYRDKVPTSNFFLRKGYERNPVAKRNNTVSSLIEATKEKMDSNMRNSGAQQLYQAFNN